MKSLKPFLCAFSLLVAAQAEPPKASDGATSPPKSSEAEPSLSLDVVTTAVLERNPSIRAARAKWEAMKQRVPQAAAWDDPQVSANTRLGRFVNVAPNSFTDQMVSVEQMIPVSGKNLSRSRIAAAEALSALEELRRKELDAVSKARVSYIRLAKGYALLNLNQENEASLKQSLDITRAKLEVAGQSQAEVLTAEAELVRLTETRRDLERAISEEQTQLKVLMNRDPFSELGRPSAQVLEAHDDVPSLTRLRALLLSNRPELRMAEANITAAKAKLQLAQREWIPDPTLSLQVQRYNEGSQAISEVGAGVSFSMPWFNGRKYRAEESEAKHEVDAAEHEFEAAKTESLGLLRDQLQKIETFHHHTELFASRLIPNVRQTVETNRTNYEGGKATFLELFLSQRNLRETQAMQIEHLADYRIALAELDALVGAGSNAPKSQKPKRK